MTRHQKKNLLFAALLVGAAGSVYLMSGRSDGAAELARYRESMREMDLARKQAEAIAERAYRHHEDDIARQRREMQGKDALIQKYDMETSKREVGALQKSAEDGDIVIRSVLKRIAALEARTAPRAVAAPPPPVTADQVRSQALDWQERAIRRAQQDVRGIFDKYGGRP